MSSMRIGWRAAGSLMTITTALTGLAVVGSASASQVTPARASHAGAVATPVAGATTHQAVAAGTISNYTGAAITSPFGMVVGPDGALWFTNLNNGSIGRITMLGTTTTFANPAMNEPGGITVGPDKALWFANFNSNSIGRMPTSGLGVTDFVGTGISEPTGIAVGSDGALWFTNYGNNSIGRITTGGKVKNYVGAGISSPGRFDHGIVQGPDGAMWFTNWANSTIGRITTSGTVTDYRSPSISEPADITVGPDGALWFSNYGNHSIGRITTSGTVTNFTAGSCVPVPPATACISEPIGIATGMDGNLWFVNQGNNTVSSITTSGTVTNYNPFNSGVSNSRAMAAAPDGALWFTNYGNASIGRITTAVTPAITSFSPGSGAQGAAVTITGVNLGTANGVAFNGVKAAITATTATTVTTSVPAGASTGHITVTTPAGTAISAKSFKVVA